MIKKILLAVTVLLTTVQIKAQNEEARELTCYNKWSQKFDERGAEEVEDGVYTDVIITSRIGSKANCWSGKAEVRNKKLIKSIQFGQNGMYQQTIRLWPLAKF